LGTTSKKAELTALARALTLAKNKTINIYTDSKYAFHTFCKIVPFKWKEEALYSLEETICVRSRRV
jgi:ribonuclease HI